MAERRIHVLASHLPSSLYSFGAESRDMGHGISTLSLFYAHYKDAKASYL